MKKKSLFCNFLSLLSKNKSILWQISLKLVSGQIISIYSQKLIKNQFQVWFVTTFNFSSYWFYQKQEMVKIIKNGHLFTKQSPENDKSTIFFMKQKNFGIYGFHNNFFNLRSIWPDWVCPRWPRASCPRNWTWSAVGGFKLKFSCSGHIILGISTTCQALFWSTSLFLQTVPPTYHIST